MGKIIETSPSGEKKVLSPIIKKYADAFVYASNSVQVESGTTLSCSIDCKIGQTILAFVVVRSALTISNDWNLIQTSNIVEGDTFNQTLSVIWKRAASLKESITITQSISARIYITMLAIENCKNFKFEKFEYFAGNHNNWSFDTGGNITIYGFSATTYAALDNYSFYVLNKNKNISNNHIENIQQPRLQVFFDNLLNTNLTLKYAVDNQVTSNQIIAIVTLNGGAND